MNGTLEIHGMEFHSFHGCLPEERENGGDYLVDVVCSLDLQKAAGSDCLEDTLDCAALYGVVAKEMETPSNLIENVAWRIRQSVMKAFPEAVGCEVSVSKKNPPLDGPAAYSKVTLK